MVDALKQSRVPWRVAVGLGAIAIVLAAALGWLLVRHDDQPSFGLSASEQAAVDAATREMIDVQSFRLADFDADFARATSGLTGGLLKELTSKKASLLDGLKKSKLDTTAAVTEAAFEESKGSDAVVLLTMNNYRVDKTGKKTLFGSGRFEVTVSKVNNAWLASDLTSIGLL